jgi:putative ABC transport system ATP-binding protein
MTVTTRSSISAGDTAGVWQTLRRGFELSPALGAGIGVTMVLAVVSTIGSSVIPVVIQQTLDHGLLADGSVDRGLVWGYLALAAAVVLATSVAGYAMKYRLFRASEAGLADLRIQAFRHVHDLPVLTQDTERRGALVSRVTSDVDQVSLFLQFSGLLVIISTGQLLVATVIMAVYSWQLTLVVWLCFAPLFVSLKLTQPRMTRAYARVRSTIGDMLSAISEPVVGASVVAW